MSSPIAWTLAQSNALNSVSILFKDSVGNISSCYSASITHDSAAPTIAVTSPSGGSYINLANQASYSVSGTCSENGQSVTINVDSVSSSIACSGGAFTKSFDVSAVGEGSVSITAEITDLASNASTSSAVSVTKDTVRPTAAVTTPYLNLGTVNSSNQSAYTLSGTCSENGRSLSISGDVTGTVSCSGGAWSQALDLSALSDGAISLSMSLTDVAGNPLSSNLSISLTKDTAALSGGLTINSGATYTNSTSVTLNLTTGGNEMYITSVSGCGSGGSWEAFSSSKSYTLSSSNASNTVYVKYKNSAGNISSCYSASITHDNVAPTIAVTSPSGGSYINLANQASYSVSGTCSENGQSVTINVDSVSSSIACSGGAFTKSFDVSAVGEGSVSITAEITDLASNATTSSAVSVTKDTVRPTATVTTPYLNLGTVNSSNQSAYTLSGTCSENGRSLSISGDITGTVSCSGGAWSQALDLSALSDGAVSLSMSLTDLAGNPLSSNLSISLTKNTAAVTGTIAINSGATYTNSTSVTLNLTTGGDEMYITNISGCGSGGSWEVFSSSKSYTLSNTNTSNTAYVKYRNSYGNVSSCLSASINHDSVAPTVVISTPTAGDVINFGNQSSYTVSGTCSENGSVVSISASTVTATPTCTAGAFTANLNLTSLSDGAVSINASQIDSAANTGNATSVGVTKTIVVITSTISGEPTSTNTTTTLAVTVAGTSVTQYSYKVGVSASTDCTAATGYSSFIVVATQITESISSLADGDIKLCVIGKDGSGNTQTYASATSATWTKDTSAPSLPSSITLGAEFAATAGTVSPTVTWTDGVDTGSGISDHQVRLVNSNTSAEIVAYAAHTKGTGMTGLSLSAGKYHFEIKATDILGNASSAASSSFVICPSNYIYVPPKSPFTSSGFCVMKWEAKNSGGIAVSQAASTPNVNVNRATAITRCKANTPTANYDLISSNEWMSIARNIEAVSTNWSSGTVGSGYVASGHYNSSTDNPCNGNNAYGSWSSGCVTTGSFDYYRKLNLNNSEIIWDFGGNVYEWVKDNVTNPAVGTTGLADHMFSEDSSEYTSNSWTMSNGMTDTIKNLFGPLTSAASCNSNADNYCGFGVAGINYNGDAMVRGGYYGDGGGGGIFNVKTYYYDTDVYINLGYRCTYHP